MKNIELITNQQSLVMIVGSSVGNTSTAVPRDADAETVVTAGEAMAVVL